MSSEPSLPDPDAFNALVWKIVEQVPAGNVFTYGQIAALLPCPAGLDEKVFRAYRSRWVGTAMSKSPGGVPWQRIINSQGKISFKPGPMANEQRSLLETEGVIFDDRQRIDLARFGWPGPDKAWIRENGLVSPDEEEQSGQLSLF